MGVIICSKGILGKQAIRKYKYENNKKDRFHSVLLFLKKVLQRNRYLIANRALK
jgi:hypothetical protein